MSENKVKGIYSYEKFALEIIAIAKGEKEMTKEIAERVIKKATDLLKTSQRKATYSKSSKPKGASEKTLAKAALMKKGLSKGIENAKTGAEINTLINEDFSVLEYANTLKYLAEVAKTKVIRNLPNNKGLMGERELTAYYLLDEVEESETAE